MNLIIFENKDYCDSYLTWLNDELFQLNVVGVDSFTHSIKHPTESKWAIVLEFIEPYASELNDLFNKVQLDEWTDDWKIEDDTEQ